MKTKDNTHRAGGKTLVPPVVASRMLRGLMLRDLALLLVNRIKKNIFLVNTPLKWLLPEALFSPKYTKYRLAAGLSPDPLGSLQRSPDP